MANAKAQALHISARLATSPKCTMVKPALYKRNFNVHLVCSSVLFRGSDSAEN